MEPGGSFKTEKSLYPKRNNMVLHYNLLLHATENTIVIFVTPSTRLHVEVIVTVFHLDIFAPASHLASSKALWLTLGKTVDESRTRKRSSLVKVLGWDWWYRGCI
uniref:Uncharacterized protein n=1 Tax=Photinus pyralis TaxID=7054 RepID=A0A1Y1NQ15_PHOPY